MKRDFGAAYGPWAVVAGASDGLGAAFATALAQRGLHLVLVARRAEKLAELANRLTEEHGVQVRPLVWDLADGRFGDAVREAVADLEVGLAVYNAAYSFVGPLLEHSLEDALRVIDVNCRGPMRLVHALAPGMLERGHGGLVLMASLAGFQGGPGLAAYAASKAFNIVLGEGLAAELRPRGVDVVVACPGAVRTPNYQQAAHRDAPGTLDSAVVVERTLAALGRSAIVVPGAVNKVATFFLRRLLPRSTAVGIMQSSVKELV